jgi:hypothetical protein
LYNEDRHIDNVGVTVFALRKLGVNDEGILIKEHYNESGVRVSS